MRQVGSTLFKFITCLSLLASIGSFVIAALPVLPQIAAIHEQYRVTPPQALDGGAKAPPRVFSEWSQAERNDFVLRYGLSLVALFAVALAITRMIRIQRGDFSEETNS